MIADKSNRCPYCSAVIYTGDIAPKMHSPRSVHCPSCMETGSELDSVCRFCGKPMKIQNIPGHLPVMFPLQNGMNIYLIGTSIGQGGFGITYIAWDVSLNKKVAVKEFFPSKYAVRTGLSMAQVSVDVPHTKAYIHGRENFVREAQSLARFSDEPNIVHVKEVFYANNTAYIIMEFLEGITLKEYIGQTGPISYTEAVNLIVPVMGAISQIHAASFIHRDISPDNIMLMANGNIKLLDFGAAKEYLTSESDNTGSHSGSTPYTVVLKYGFAPIEQYQANSIQGPWTDIYAIAATIYFMITGKRPVNSIDRISGDLLELPCGGGYKITPDQQMVLLKGMAIQPEARYQKVEDFLFYLKSVRGQEEAQILAKEQHQEQEGIFRKAKKPFGDGNIKKVYTKKAVRHLLILIFVLAASAAAVTFPRWKNRALYAMGYRTEDFRDHRMEWHDESLEKMIREAVGKKQGTLMLSDVIVLKRLDLSASDISDISDLAELTGLEYLDISLTKVCDLSVLAKLKNMKSLWCQYCNITDLSPISGLEKLVELHADHNQIEDIQVLGTMPSVRKITLSDNLIRDVSVLEQLPDKCSIDLTSNPAENIENYNDGRLKLKY